MLLPSCDHIVDNVQAESGILPSGNTYTQYNGGKVDGLVKYSVPQIRDFRLDAG